MSRRIEIELTSDRGDGTWTWRAAGARQPKGVLDASLLPSGAKTGDVVRAEVETDIEGHTVLSIATGPARQRTEPERIELTGGARDDEQLVTTQLVGKRDRGERRDRRDRPPRGDRPEGGRPGEGRRDGPRRDRPARPAGERADRPERGAGGGERREGAGERPARRERPDRPRRPAPPPLPERPKPKRLRAGRTHRKAVLAEVAQEHQPIAEQVLKGGIAAVRQAIDAENDKRAAGGQPPINATELLAIAEQLLPRLRAAEWRDRAEAALADADELDLRDLRSVVVAADGAARDDETRAMAAQLREKLDQRVESEQATWLEDLGLALDAGRVVRALRLSSRPPKAGTMLPPDLRTRLVEAANAGLSADVGADRWAAVLDAAAYAPVRGDVKPVSVPETPGEDLLAAVRKYGSRVPGVAAAFGIEAPARPAGRALRPPKPPRRPGTVPVPERETKLGTAPPPPLSPEPTATTPTPSAPEGGAPAQPAPEPSLAEAAPAGAQPAPAAVEPDAAAPAAPVAPASAPTVPDAAAPEPPAETTPTPAGPTGAAGEPSAAPAQESESATTSQPDAGVAEAATPVEETSAAADEPLDAAQDDPRVDLPADATPAGPPNAEPVAEPAAESTGAPPASTPTEGGESPDAAEALAAAPDLDELSDGEPTVN